MIETRPGAPLERRLADIHARVCDLIAEHRPDGARRSRTSTSAATPARAFAVGQARGVVLLSAGMARRALLLLHAAGGQAGGLRLAARREKDQVQRMVGALLSLPEPPEPDHAADALAVAICHANGAPLERAEALRP